VRHRDSSSISSDRLCNIRDPSVDIDCFFFFFLGGMTWKSIDDQFSVFVSKQDRASCGNGGSSCRSIAGAFVVQRLESSRSGVDLNALNESYTRVAAFLES